VHGLEGAEIMVEEIVLLILAVALLVYLIVTLLRPEKF
jgi:K+-transporting ATPase KdpF subunit